MRHFLKLVTTCLAAAAALGGCGGGSLSALDGSVRLLDATSAFTSLDLYDGTTKVSSGVLANTVGPYVQLNRGSHTFNLADSSTGVTSATLTGDVAKGDHYTIVAYASAGTLTTTYLSDEEGSPSSGTAKIRFFNTASSSVGNVDAYVVATACANLSSSLAAPIATAVSGLQAAYTQVNATGGGTAYHICVTTSGDKTALRLDIPAVTLKDQQIVTVILTPSPGGVLLNGLLLQQQGSLIATSSGSARIRLAVGVTGGGTVTASANGVVLGSNLPTPAVGSYVVVPSGPVTLAVTIGGVAVPDPGLSAAPGADLTLLVAGTGSTPPVLIADDNSASTSTSNPVKLRLVNGMDTTNPAVLTDNFINVGSPAAFGTSSGYAQVQASTALALLQASTGTTPLCQSASVTLSAGDVYTVFLLGNVPTSAGACVITEDR